MRLSLAAMSDRRGASAVEFALLAPVLLIALMGVLDLGYNMYTASVIEGAIQAAARSSALEGADKKLDAIDAQVTKAIRDIAPNAQTPVFARTSYPYYSSAGKPEDYKDTNGNGKCDKGEPFEDMNENGTWDTDQGRSGQGSARDIVVYQVTVTYPRPFPIGQLLGMGSDFTLNSKTVLGNQPWDNLVKTPPMRNCP